LTRVIERIRSQSEEHLEDLQDFLRIPSISADADSREAVQEAARWLSDRLEKMGASPEIVQTEGHPIVCGELPGPEDAPTLLVYGHYDVQPVDPLELWDSAPFEPEIREGAVFARGASDDKGQLLCHVFAAEALLAEQGALPVKLKFLFEGEEEVGSPSLKPFVLENLDRLSCDAVLVSDTSFYSREIPSLLYGLRGLAYVELRLRGPNRDLHSGEFGGAVANPADVLARMIASLHDENRRVNVPGFYDRVRPLEDSEREAFASLPFREEEYCRELGVEALEGEEAYTALEQLWARPTLEVNGMWSGFTGEGAKTVLPSEASAKLSMRLVPDQDPREIEDALEAHLRAIAPDSVKLEFIRHHGGNPFLAAPDNAFVRAARDSVSEAFGREPVMLRSGGSIPVVETFSTQLRSPVVLMGFGLPDDRLHSPNEKMDLDQFHKGIEACALFLNKAARVGSE
jgi:acetylornithine deacetylase/succinyl-diaminopimelate desuccinylase-like protein